MKIVFAGGGLAQQTQTIRSLLGGDHEVLFVQAGDRAQLIEAIRDAEVLVTARVDAGLLDHAPRLRLLHTPGAGVDKIDFGAVPPHVAVANTYGHGQAIAEHILLLMLALARNLLVADQELRAGRWNKSAWNPALPVAQQLRNKRLGIVGLGNIGRSLLELVAPFGMVRMGIRQSSAPDPELAAQLSFLGDSGSLDRLLREADFLVLCLPLTDETRGLIGERELRLMKPSAYLVNVARAEIVEEEALYRALKEQWIAGAGLDAWYQEPKKPGVLSLPSRLPFWELPNVIMTPHIAGVTQETFANRLHDIVENIRRLGSGEPLINLVRRPADVEAGDRR